MGPWIRAHWFELITLVLLCLNLWFVLEVLQVLSAVKEALAVLAAWLNQRHASDNDAGAADDDTPL